LCVHKCSGDEDLEEWVKVGEIPLGVGSYFTGLNSTPDPFLRSNRKGWSGLLQVDDFGSEVRVDVVAVGVIDGDCISACFESGLSGGFGATEPEDIMCGALDKGLDFGSSGCAASEYDDGFGVGVRFEESLADFEFFLSKRGHQFVLDVLVSICDILCRVDRQQDVFEFIICIEEVEIEEAGDFLPERRFTDCSVSDDNHGANLTAQVIRQVNALGTARMNAVLSTLSVSSWMCCDGIQISARLKPSAASAHVAITHPNGISISDATIVDVFMPLV
jgi:hypothetical protein